MVVCVHLPRFELAVVAGDPRWETSIGRSPDARGARAGGRAARRREQRVGEVSGAAEAQGVARGMVLGEALARCPELVLLPGDPVRVAEAWERRCVALESIGAAVEPAAPGLAYFEADGLRGIHGTQEADDRGGPARAGRPACLPTRGVHIGAAPTRFCALAAALAARSRRPLVLEGREARRWLAGRPVELLGFREETAALLEPLIASGRAHARRAGEARARGAHRPLRGSRARSPTGWPAARTVRCARAARRSAWRRRWRSATRAPARR